MSDLYNRIYGLCQKKGISIGKMCNELGISRGNLTELKMERIKTLKADNLKKISSFFGVSVDYLLTGAEQKKVGPPLKEDEDEDIIILSRNAKKLSPQKRKQLLDMAKIMFKEEFDS